MKTSKKLHMYLQWLKALGAIENVLNNLVEIQLSKNECGWYFHLAIANTPYNEGAFSKLPQPEISEMYKSQLIKYDKETRNKLYELRVLSVGSTPCKASEILDIVTQVHDQIDDKMKDMYNVPTTDNFYPLIIMYN